jgi:hypothetical protein
MNREIEQEGRRREVHTYRNKIFIPHLIVKEQMSTNCCATMHGLGIWEEGLDARRNRKNDLSSDALIFF